MLGLRNFHIFNEISPIKSKSGRFEIILSGQIYNYKKIATQYGYDLASAANFLLDAIESKGLKEALAMSKGSFALAVYDFAEEKLSLARDRIGEKPLCYGFVGGKFTFAFDLNTITGLIDFNNPLNTDVLGLYFTYGYIPAPYTIYQDIFKLDAGMILEIKAPYSDVTIYPYWSLSDVVAYGQKNLFKGSRTEAADELERLLKEAIKEQLPIDVPTGAFLSAGIDSSTVISLMQVVAGKKVNTFTIGMPYSNDDTAYDEAIYAREIAAYLGCEHTEQYISEEDLVAVIPLLDTIYGEPFADTSQIPTYIVSQLAGEKMKVMLGGDGGDELFCGYHSYRSVENAYKRLNRIPYFIRKPISHILLKGPFTLNERNQGRANFLGMDNAADIYVSSYEYYPIVRKISLTDTKLPYKYNEIDPYFCKEPNHQLMLMDLTMYTPDDIMVKVERSAKAAGIECRAPMLDKDIIEFAFSLPIEYKRNDEIGKLVLRDVLYRYVPRELMERPKQGFGIPIYDWLKKPALKDWAEQLITRDTIVRQGILDPDIVHQIWSNFINNNQFIPQIWYILMFQTFMLRSIDK